MSGGNRNGWSRCTGRYDLATGHDPKPRSSSLIRHAFCDKLYDVEIRRIICSTNAIESLNARYRRAIKARGHFPSEQAALKCLYLVTRSLDPTGRGKARWAMRWKPALNAFAITFDGRIVPSGLN
jgi:transposase-like protein